MMPDFSTLHEMGNNLIKWAFDQAIVFVTSAIGYAVDIAKYIFTQIDTLIPIPPTIGGETITVLEHANCYVPLDTFFQLAIAFCTIAAVIFVFRFIIKRIPFIG